MTIDPDELRELQAQSRAQRERDGLPLPADDVFDRAEFDRHGDRHRRLVPVAEFAPAIPNIADGCVSRWLGKEPLPLVFTIADLVPQGMVTLFVSEGGSGKSLLCQTAIACVATGQPFLGKAVEPGSAAGLFAEDDENVLHIRQRRINESLGIDEEPLTGRAFVQSYLGTDVALWHDGEPTDYLGELERQLSGISDLRLVALDNVALLYADDENDRIAVTRFLNVLNGLAQRLKAAVVLTSHVSKTSDKSSLRAASGSTAWVNASRSVLRLDKGEEDDKVNLRLVKANHSKPGEEISLEWRERVLALEPDPDSFDMKFRNRAIDKLIFDICEKGWDEGVPCSDKKNQGHRYLPGVVARQSDFKVREVERAMIAHIDAGNLKPGQRANTRTPVGIQVIRRPEEAAAAFD